MNTTRATHIAVRLLATVSLLCATCRAFGDFFDPFYYDDYYSSHYASEFEVFGDFQNFHVLESRIIPVHLMMDNEKLFLAAEAEKDASMGMVNRILNNQWLAHRGQLNRSDLRALKTFLRRNVVSFLRHEYRPQRDRNPYQHIDDPNYEEYSQFKNIDNYQLNISDDRIEFRFFYAFN